MKRYQRSSECEKTKMLINEDYQEQLEYQDELEEIRAVYWSGLAAKSKEDNPCTKILPAFDRGYNKKMVDKVERVRAEMLDENLEEYANYRNSDGRR